ncbi:MAG: PadR family transcriptional regulator [SAR202 cluster bacterium]|jgi:DNA-binding PadR family transcriptional regulator|nr:PadR family transcriptional regulator [SAR202 cluster bacterium]MDP6512380.1 PadR family transcriptional regulator [SAR202 cluster bacterium]MDP6714878.1 PadR family transcriptional regulator [SAR202 cluster bacterium]
MRNAILALLAAGAAYGYELKQALDSQFEAVWPPINIGQIYATLQRLERDGLVVSETVAQERRPNRKVYSLTGAGHEELKDWLDAPTSGPRLKDDFFVKLVVARASGVVDPIELIRRQSEEYFQTLSDLDAMVANQNGNDERMSRLLIEGAALHIQADIRWLELCEQVLTEE